MKPKHSPAPWKIRDNQLTVEGSDGRAVCQFNWMLRRRAGDKRDYSTQEANARLIAAAPDLLVQLKDLVRCIREFQLGDYSPLMDEIFDSEAAIRDAEGGK